MFKEFLQESQLPVDNDIITMSESTNELSSSDLLNKIDKEYDITTEGKYTYFKVSNGGDFPYRISEINGTFLLSKGFSPRKYVPVKYKSVKKSNNIDDLYVLIIKRHNKSLPYLINANRIDV